MISASMQTQKFFGMRFDGGTYDTGSKIGFLMANVAYALERDELGHDLPLGDRGAAAPER